MDSLFDYGEENIDVILMYSKRRLMLHDEYAQLSSMEQISKLFRSGGAGCTDAVLSKLIKFDVLSAIFEILQAPSDRLLSCILEFLSLISVHRMFYECHVAITAIDSILKVTICVLKSRNEGARILWKLVSMIDDILKRAIEFNIEFHAVCPSRQTLFLLKSLFLETTMDQKLKFSAVSLLHIVLQNIDTENECEDSLFEISHKALTLMKEIVEYSDDSGSTSLAAFALCAICSSSIRLCVAEADSRGISYETARCRGTLAKAIYMTMMNTLIPYVKSAESNETDRVKFHRNLVTCLNSLYKLSNCSRDNLSNHLTANGYLKHFLLLTARLPENLRRSTCMLLSRIITTLADKSLPIGQWPDGATGFENSMHRGLLDLPRDIQQWNNVTPREGNSSIALMTLIYYHFHGTREFDMITLEFLIARIMNISNDQTPTQIMKVLWFLFAIASISHPSPSVVQDYGRATQRLSKLLQHSRLHECYTHHIDLLRYCLTYREVPRDLWGKAMDLWLIESDGDIKPLLTLDRDKVARHCLLLVTQAGYSKKMIKLAMKGLREMIRMDKAKEIAKIAWHMLPNLLSLHHPDKDEQVNAVLELTNIFIPDSLSLNVMHLCADSLLTIILRRDANLKLKTLAVMQSYVLLVTSATAKPFTIFEKCVRTPNFLEELLVQGFSEETPDLASACLKLLAFIVHCQKKLPIERDKPLIIEAQSLASLLITARNSVQFLSNATLLVLELFSQNEASIFPLGEIVNERVTGVINLYVTLNIIHDKCGPIQRDTVYQCLGSILRFCHTQAQPLMYHLCTIMCNEDLVKWTFYKRHTSSHFLEFVSTWLRYRRRHCNDEGQWNERSICKTPFEETLDLISEYVAALKDVGVDSAVNNLRYAVSLFSK